MICKQCGNEIAPGAKFCGSCGAPVEVAAADSDATTVLEQNNQPQYEQSQYAQPQYDQQPQYAQPQQYQQPQYDQQQYQQYQQPQQYQQYQQPQQYQQYQQPVYNQGMPVENPVERSLSKSVLIFGILGIAFACTFYFSFLGIIFGAIALSKAKKYVASGFALEGRAKVGKILGMVGLILGIVLTVILLIVIVIAIIAASSYSSYYNSSYYYY